MFENVSTSEAFGNRKFGTHDLAKTGPTMHNVAGGITFTHLAPPEDYPPCMWWCV